MMMAGEKASESDIKHFENCIDKLTVSGTATKVHHNEQEDGEEIQGLDLGIQGFKKW